jgi:hypothetical protein
MRLCVYAMNTQSKKKTQLLEVAIIGAFLTFSWTLAVVCFLSIIYNKPDNCPCFLSEMALHEPARMVFRVGLFATALQMEFLHNKIDDDAEDRVSFYIFKLGRARMGSIASSGMLILALWNSTDLMDAQLHAIGSLLCFGLYTMYVTTSRVLPLYLKIATVAASVAKAVAAFVTRRGVLFSMANTLLTGEADDKWKNLVDLLVPAHRTFVGPVTQWVHVTVLMYCVACHLQCTLSESNKAETENTPPQLVYSHFVVDHPPSKSD